MKIVITNSFTAAQTVVDASKPMTAAKAKSIRRRLCGDDCKSGDTLGGRGSQSEGYAALLERAERAVLTGETC